MISKLNWLLQQFYQMAEPCPEWWSFIHHHNIDLKAVAPHCGVVAVALCKSYDTIEGDRLFEFSPQGIPCVVVEAISFRRKGGNTNPYTGDLIAWPLNSPDQFATALASGEGCELLGAWSACRTDRSPLALHRTPLSWLKAGCEGVVLLKPGAGPWLRKAGGPYRCEDAEHAREVTEILGSSVTPYEIFIPQARRAA